MKKGTVAAISALFGVIGGIVTGASLTSNVLGEANEKNRKLSDKHLALFLLMNQWVKIKQERKNVSSYLEKNGYKRIAIYGMSYVGETLVSELDDTEIEILYGIDQNAKGIYTDIKILSLEEDFEDVDAVIVTAITCFDEIQEELGKKINCPIINIEDILYDM